jgi:hypothetical protein
MNVPTGKVLATVSGSFTEFLPGGKVGAVGVYTEEVIRDSVSHNIDFLYQLKLTTGHMNHVITSSFAGFKITNFGYSTQTKLQLNAAISGNILVAGTAKPTLVGRSPGVVVQGQHLNAPNGGQIDFLFPTPKLSGPPATTSAVLFLDTNSPSFEAGNITLINGLKQSFAGFQPGPEPSSIVLLATGIVGLCGYAWRRHKVQPV